MPNPLRLSRKVAYNDGDAVPIVVGNGTRVNATAAVASTAEAALPTGATGSVVIVRATDAIWIRFGTTGMGAAAADANSILFLGGEAPILTPDSATHFRVLRVGSADVAVQLEAVAAIASS